MRKHSEYTIAYKAGRELAIASFIKRANQTEYYGGDQLDLVENEARLRDQKEHAEQDKGYTERLIRANAPELDSALEPELGAGVPTPIVPERLGYSAVRKGDTNYNRIARRLRQESGFSNLTGRQLAQFMGNRNLRVGDQIDLDQLRGSYAGTGDTARPAAGVGQVFRQRGNTPTGYAVVNRGVLPSRRTSPAPIPAMASQPAGRRNLVPMLEGVLAQMPGGAPGMVAAPFMGPPSPAPTIVTPRQRVQRPQERVTYLGEATPADRPALDDLLANLRSSLQARGGR